MLKEVLKICEKMISADVKDPVTFLIILCKKYPQNLKYNVGVFFI